ncbi:GNAT family protein [Roseibium denhamense]|uniref:GNAT family N-acetyltransferase n=1 Tax=Roseibium denhamense TaxID=76305 RepID=UPI0031382E58
MITGSPRTLKEFHRKLDDWVEMNALSGEGTLEFAICRADGGGLIGDISLRITNVEAGQAEIGFSLHPGRQGKGYALEAASAFLEFGFGALKLHRIFGRCDARNAGSWKLMERLGMRREAHFREHALFKGEWDEEYYYAILNREWQARTGEQPPQELKTALNGWETGPL